MIKLSDYIWNEVSALGVKNVFMFPGGGAMHLVDSLGSNKDIEHITLLHEQACVMAAETYARVAESGIGVVLVTTGPGGSNTITGVAAAWLESTPCIIISGQVKTSDLKDSLGVRQNGNQELGIVDIVKSITKYAVTVKKPEDIRYHFEKATYLAMNGRQGPVWLDIPLDVQAAMIKPSELNSCFDSSKKQTHKTLLTDGLINDVFNTLKNSKRPVVLAGEGVLRAHAGEALLELVTRLNIPLLTSWLAVDIIPYNHSLNIGKPGMVAPRYSNFAMQNADCLLSIGCRLDASEIGYDHSNFAPKAKKIIVDIDENEIKKLQTEIALEVVADAGEFISAIAAGVEQKGFSTDYSEWIKQCALWKKKYPVVLTEYRESENYVNAYNFVDVLSDALTENDVIVPGSSGACIDVFWMSYKNKKGQKSCATGGLGSMGYGLPASIGACIAAGRKRTICFEGDGSIQLNIQELANVVGLNLPIKIFVMDNGGYLSIRNMQKSHFEGRLVGSNRESGLLLPDIAAISRAYGIKTYKIESHDGLHERIQEVLATEEPALCVVKISDDLVIAPKVISKVSEDGSMISGKLEDLWPFLSEKEMKENIL